MKVLLLGKTGQVGLELEEKLNPVCELIALGREHNDLFCGDLTRLTELRSAIRQIKPDVVVNAAAYTDVESAENNREIAYCVNAIAVEAIAEECYRSDSLFIHYSTDYVFDGTKESAWLEDDQKKPLNLYGRSKAQGEDNIIRSGCRYIILRTSWVFSLYRKNFALSIMAMAKERAALNIINDQIGVPTSAHLIAKVTSDILAKIDLDADCQEVYHLSAMGKTTWFQYAKYLIELMQVNGEKVVVEQLSPILSKDYNAQAIRPKNSLLNTQKIQKRFLLELPAWQSEVDLFYIDYRKKDDAT